MERTFHLLSGAAKLNPRPAPSYALHRQALRPKPGRDPVHVIFTGSEAVGVLLRRQPLAIIGRSWVLLISQQLIESRLLAGGMLQIQRHLGERKGRGHRTLIHLPTHAWRHVPRQNDSFAVVARRSDAIGLRVQSGGQNAESEYKGSKA